MVGFLVYSDCFTMMTFSTSDVLATVMMALSFSSSLRCMAQRFRNVFSSSMLALSRHGVRGLCRRFRGFVGFGGAGVLYAGSFMIVSLRVCLRVDTSDVPHDLGCGGSIRHVQFEDSGRTIWRVRLALFYYRLFDAAIRLMIAAYRRQRSSSSCRFERSRSSSRSNCLIISSGRGIAVPPPIVRSARPVHPAIAPTVRPDGSCRAPR